MAGSRPVVAAAMTWAEAVRLLGSAGCMVAIIGSLGEMRYGPRRAMSWAQFLRYLSLTIVLGTILVDQFMHRHLPLTGYTVSFTIGALVGTLGVAPILKKPMRRARP